MNANDYEKRGNALEAGGITRSDAQGIVDAENMPTPPLFTFRSPYVQYAKRNGETCKYLCPVDPATYDRYEVGDLYWVEFNDGERIEAWPEELHPVEGTEA